ncbi:MAG: geranylgeranyl reductase family protein [Desulfomonilaceae bacterium]|nr:geranylgeranyl reductase family protein [Desulfomonilaceae bacterium]
MIPFDSFHILVVGAGPAGGRAAAAAASAGVPTLLIDAKSRIGEQPHCGEFVPRRFFTEFGISTDCIVQPVSRMETRVTNPSALSTSAGDRMGHSRYPRPGGSFDSSGHAEISAGTEEKVSTDSPGYTIDRPRLDRSLAREAAAAGATVLSAAGLVRRENDCWVLRSDGREVTTRPSVVIAADGALSTVASLLGMRRPEVLLGVQVEAPLAQPQAGTFVFLDPRIVGGYGWLFPKGNTANVGIGMEPGSGTAPRRVLDAMLETIAGLGLIRPGRLARSSGVIAVSGLRRDLVVGNVILCGDAAGLTHPITGAGVPQAAFSGHLAGVSAAAAVKSGDGKYLHDYELEIRGRYAGILGHALAKRRVMKSKWRDPDFSATCKQTWIAFKEYRKRVR